MMEDYRRVDDLAEAALGRMFAEDDISADRAVAAAVVAPRRAMRYHRGWWLIPGAIAAAVLALVIPRPVFQNTVTSPLVLVDGGQTSLPAVPGNNLKPRGELMRDVGSAVRRDTGREVFGVIGDDGGIYWIEVDRTRTIKRPKRRPADAWTNGGV